MPRSRPSPLQKLVQSFLDLGATEQGTLIELFVAIYRRRIEAVPVVPAGQKTRKPRVREEGRPDTAAGDRGLAWPASRS